MKKLVKNFAKKMLSDNQIQALKSVLKTRRLNSNYRYDYLRFKRYSTAIEGVKTKTQMQSTMAFNYHRLEKGMALPAPRTGFAEATVYAIIDDLKKYVGSYGHDRFCDDVVAVLKEYQSFHKDLGTSFPKLDAYLADEQEPAEGEGAGGVIRLPLTELFPVESSTACRFIKSRHSVRNYTGETVDKKLLLDAVQLAQSAPSVCNRQSARVYVSNDPEVIATILAHQNGNRGFGETLGAVFIVASETEVFMNVGERNQPLVDGGIFAMTLVQGLHALELGACMLNWSMEREADTALRRQFNIPDSQVVITLIGAGYPVNDLKVAASPRLATEEIVTWLN